MTKENYLFQGTREKAVREAQAVVDFMVPGKVKVYCEWCEDTNRWYMVGAYQSYIDLGERKTPTSVTSFKREKMDRYYDVSVFAAFFKQRTAYMNANYYWQLKARENNIHPAMFKEWFDSKKRTTSDMVSA